MGWLLQVLLDRLSYKGILRPVLWRTLIKLPWRPIPPLAQKEAVPLIPLVWFAWLTWRIQLLTLLGRLKPIIRAMPGTLRFWVVIVAVITTGYLLSWKVVRVVLCRIRAWLLRTEAEGNLPWHRQLLRVLVFCPALIKTRARFPGAEWRTLMRQPCPLCLLIRKTDRATPLSAELIWLISRKMQLPKKLFVSTRTLWGKAVEHTRARWLRILGTLVLLMTRWTRGLNFTLSTWLVLLRMRNPTPDSEIIFWLTTLVRWLGAVINRLYFPCTLSVRELKLVLLQVI